MTLTITTNLTEEKNTMSIDLEWPMLDTALADTLVALLNRQLSATHRPSFIGPVEVTSLDFGTAAPDVELVDLRDIYRDFLEDDEDEEEDKDEDEDEDKDEDEDEDKDKDKDKEGDKDEGKNEDKDREDV